MLASWLEELLAVLLPRVCARCGRQPPPGAPLCPACERRIPRLPPGGCLLCQAPGPGPRCPACARARAGLAACVAEVPFTGEAAAWVRRFKYRPRGLSALDPRPGVVLGAWLEAAAARLPRPREAPRVVPVPLHARRLRQRGFHPAGELARPLARALGLRLEARLLERVRDTPSQTGLSRRARRRNLAGAFRVRTGAPLPRCVLLVDDVVTTGATLESAARTLRRAGVRTVMAACVARTPADRAG